MNRPEVAGTEKVRCVLPGQDRKFRNTSKRGNQGASYRTAGTVISRVLCSKRMSKADDGVFLADVFADLRAVDSNDAVVAFRVQASGNSSQVVGTFENLVIRQPTMVAAAAL
jgi:hypothetical protein